MGIVRREYVESLGASRVADAKLRYEFARSYVKEVAKEALQSPEYAEAVHAENAAQADYLRVLRLYTSVLEGKTPSETLWLKRKTAGAA